MTPQAQAQIARWMGMHKARYSPLWFKRLSHDTCRLPDPNTIEGAALWCALIKSEFWRRKLTVKLCLLPYIELVRWEILDFDEICLAVGNDVTELAALEAAVMKIMEAEG